MSAALTADVWRFARANQGPAARLVLLAVADHARAGETSAVLAVRSLMELTGLSRRGVQYAVSSLEADGELSVQQTTGPHPYNRYTIHIHYGPRPPLTDDTRPRARKRAVQSLQRTVFDKDGWECQLRLEGCTGHRYLTTGHIIAVANGGTDDLANLQTECLHCNSTKGAR